MLKFLEMTHEEAIRKTLQDDQGAAGRILAADPGCIILCSITFTYEIPANFAKAVLADAVAEATHQNLPAATK